MQKQISQYPPLVDYEVVYADDYVLIDHGYIPELDDDREVYVICYRHSQEPVCRFNSTFDFVIQEV